MARKSNWISHLLAFIFLSSTTAFAVWVVLSTWVPKTSLSIGAVSVFFLCASVGAFWMLYDCLVRERPPLIYFFVAFLPYAFVWYYFDRVLPRTIRASGLQ
jgi:hypothetical protein